MMLLDLASIFDRFLPVEKSVTLFDFIAMYHSYLQSDINVFFYYMTSEAFHNHFNVARPNLVPSSKK
jgi:hypothetical protein